MPNPKTKPENRLNDMLDKLRARECRITPQRVAIIKILASSAEHPSVETIYDQLKRDFPTMSLATVYKTVLLLKEIGEVLELEFSNGRNRYDGYRPSPHPHLICTCCKRITDCDIISMSDMMERMQNETGYQLLTHRIDFFGLCPTCRNNS